jgi:hypothetical protein
MDTGNVTAQYYEMASGNSLVLDSHEGINSLKNLIGLALCSYAKQNNLEN